MRILLSLSDGSISSEYFCLLLSSATQHWLKIAKRRSDSPAVLHISTPRISRNIRSKRKPSTICKVSCLFPLCSDMLLQAHSFIVFLHPNAAMQRLKLKDLNPFHETECQTAVVQEETISDFPLKVCPQEASHFWVFDFWEADWVWQWKIQKQFYDLIQTPLCRFHLTSLYELYKPALLLFYSCSHIWIHQVQSESRMPDRFPCSTDCFTQMCPQCFCVYPTVLAVLLMALSLWSDKSCRQSSIRATSSLVTGEGGGLDFTAFSQINKGDPGWLWKTVRDPFRVLITVMDRNNCKDKSQY